MDHLRPPTIWAHLWASPNMSLPALPNTGQLLATHNTGQLLETLNMGLPALPNTGHLPATRDTDLPEPPNTGPAGNGCAKLVVGTYSDFAPMFSPTKASNA
jgi:hypothetical protein